MEYSGRITRVLEARTGTSQRTGNEWKALPFVFYFYEPGNTQTEKSVMLETFDTNIQAQIGQYLMRGQDGKAVVMDGEYRMTVPEIPCKADFSPFFRQGTTKDGKKFNTNEIRTYKIELGTAMPQQAGQQGQGLQPQAQMIHQQLQYPTYPAGQVAGMVAQPPQPEDDNEQLPF